MSTDKINKDYFVIDKPTRLILSLMSKVNEVHVVFHIQIQFEEISRINYGSPKTANIPFMTWVICAHIPTLNKNMKDKDVQKYHYDTRLT